MKKIFTSTGIICFFLIGTAFGQLSGSYNVGDGGDYISLKAAFTDLMAEGVGGDVTFLITSDITEVENVALGVDPGSNTITIKPAPAATPVVTFTQSTGNSVYNGALIIGLTDIDGGGGDLTLTRNIIIDGSNTVGGTTRDLTLQTGTGAGNANTFRFIGDTENIQVRNTNIVWNQTGNAFNTVQVTSRSTSQHVNLLFENNYIENNTGASSARAILTDGVVSASVGPELTIRDNELVASRYGVWLREVGGSTTIEGNTITINQNTSLFAYGVLVDEKDGDTIVRGNQFVNSSSAGSSYVGVRGSADGAYEITDNTFDNVTSGDGTTRVVWVNSNGLYQINGNTFSNVTGSDEVRLIDASSNSNTIEITGNTFTDISNTSQVSAIYAQTEADYLIKGNVFSNLSSDGIVYGVNMQTGGTYTIEANEFVDFNGDGGVEMISVENNINENATVNVINNMLTGFSSGGSGENMYGVILRSPTDPFTLTLNMYHNTIRMNPLAISGTGWVYRGLSSFSNARISMELKNNIFINDDNNGTAVTSYAYYQAGSAAAGLDSNFNLWYGSDLDASDNTYLSRHGGTETNSTTLTEHQASTGDEANSVSKEVEFVSATDLRLTGASDGDSDLAGTPLAEVTEDIDGTERDSFRPYMGAFEGSTLAPAVTVTGDAGWRMMSSPVTAFTVEQLAAQTGIQGVDGGDYPGFQPNIYNFYDGTDWISPANVSEVLDSGNGFILYFFNNNEAGSSELPVSLTASGSATPSSDVTVNVHSDGSRYNLLGNPFDATIDISAITSNGTISAHAQIWVDDEGEAEAGEQTQGSWVVSSSAPFNGFVGPWQGFMMQNDEGSPATTVTIPSAAISTEEDRDFHSLPAGEKRVLAFQLDATDTGDGARSTDRAAVLHMHHQASSGWDRYDLQKLGSMHPRSALVYFAGEQGQEFVAKSLESRPYELDESLELDLGVVSYGISGTFTLSWPELENFEPGLELRLVDHHTGQTVDLRNQDSYAFEHQAAEPASQENQRFRVPELTAEHQQRFSVVIELTGTSSGGTGELPKQVELAQNYPNPFNPTTTIVYELPSQEHVRLAVYDILGRRVKSLVSEVQTAGRHSVQFDASALASGVYLYRLETGSEVRVRRMTLVK